MDDDVNDDVSGNMRDRRHDADDCLIYKLVQLHISTRCNIGPKTVVCASVKCTNVLHFIYSIDTK